MELIEGLLASNQAYPQPGRTSASPSPQRLAVLTCMDARIDVFAVLGLHLGEALVIRNGRPVTDDVLRSVALGSHVLGEVLN